MLIVYLVRKPEGPLRRPRRRWVENFKMDLIETGWRGIGWIDLAQDRNRRRALVNMVLNLRVPQNSGTFLNECTSGGLSRRARLRAVS
jgi:hypothetical protein